MPFKPILRTALLLVIGSIILTQTSCRKDKTPKQCQPMVVLGRLVKNCDGSFEYRSADGSIILVDIPNQQVVAKHEDYEGLKIEFWGGPGSGSPIINLMHENLNGKHIKDKLTPTRTLLFPDGTKLTLAATSMDASLHTISIYDGNESHQFDFATNTVKHSSLDGTRATQLDNTEPDGETATFEFTDTGLDFLNIYTEGTGGIRVVNRILLGRLFRSQPTKVDDHYDDPRLGHT